MSEIISSLLTTQNIIQGGGVLVAFGCLVAIIVIVKYNQKATEDFSRSSQDRIAELSLASARVIERNTEAHIKSAETFAKHDVLLTHVVQVLERKF